mmetsp:Transcript_30160/g.46074  ORF Transcript_30160/g.46074 Transcript_30160/m.46074 type:complete len:105 (-) Transcript_30160:4-318(-)
MQLLSTILKSVNKILDSILKDEKNVLVHCSDGWDRTAQLCALPELLLDPYYRTIEGFLVLTNKDWLDFGHQFHTRFGQLDKNWKNDKQSPVFIQYLDCVRQLIV